MTDIINKMAIAISGAPFPSAKSIAKAKAALAALADGELDAKAFVSALFASDNHIAPINTAIRAYLTALANPEPQKPFITNNPKQIEDM